MIERKPRTDGRGGGGGRGQGGRGGQREGGGRNQGGRSRSPRTSEDAPAAADTPASLPVRLWDPAQQLRFAPKRSVPPRPDGSPNTGQGRTTREALARRGSPRP